MREARISDFANSKLAATMSEFMDVIEDMRSRTAERNDAIRSNNKGREREADRAINRRLQQLSTASTYPSSYPKADRKRAMIMFEKLAT